MGSADNDGSLRSCAPGRGVPEPSQSRCHQPARPPPMPPQGALFVQLQLQTLHGPRARPPPHPTPAQRPQARPRVPPASPRPPGRGQGEGGGWTRSRPLQGRGGRGSRPSKDPPGPMAGGARRADWCRRSADRCKPGGGGREDAEPGAGGPGGRAREAAGPRAPSSYWRRKSSAGRRAEGRGGAGQPGPSEGQRAARAPATSRKSGEGRREAAAAAAKTKAEGAQGRAALSGGCGRGRPRGAGRSGDMGKGGNQGEGVLEREAPVPTFRWEEIQKHNLRTDQWLVIDRKVYDVTRWASRHPGGRRVLGHHAGEDATVRAGDPRARFPRGRREPWLPGRQPPPLPERGAPRRNGACVSGAQPAARGTEGPPAAGVVEVGPGPRDGGSAAGSPERGGSCRVHLARRHPRVRFFRADHGDTGRPREGARGPGALAPWRGRWPPRGERPEFLRPRPGSRGTPLAPRSASSGRGGGAWREGERAGACTAPAGGAVGRVDSAARGGLGNRSCGLEVTLGRSTQWPSVPSLARNALRSRLAQSLPQEPPALADRTCRA